MANLNTVVTPRVEVITGPMFCGKTEELIRRVIRYEIAGYNYQAFKPIIDDRYSSDSIASHSGSKLKATCVDCSLEDVLRNLDGNKRVYAFDEIQFFNDEILEFFYDSRFVEDKIILASGLNQDFTGRPFKFKDSNKHMGDLLASADEITHLNSFCTYISEKNICGAPATKTQRLINGIPASIDDDLVLVGGDDSYEARCNVHHFVRYG